MTFDLGRAAQHLRAEAGQERWPFHFALCPDHDPEECNHAARCKDAEHWFELPPTMDIRVVTLFQGGDLMGALTMLVGEEQMGRLTRSPALLDEYALKGLLEAWQVDRGIQMGESSASSSSSKNTSKPSRPTSNGSTGSRSRTSLRAGSHGDASVS